MERSSAQRGEAEPVGGGEEILDREDLAPEVVERALAELRRVNRLLLGYLPAVRTLRPRWRHGGGERVVVDLGTGSGDVGRALRRRAASDGHRLRMVGVDRKLSHLLASRRLGVEQHRVVADARALPLRDGAVDWSVSTLFFHHFGAADNRRILAEMRRVARGGAAVIDLRRSRMGALLARLLIPLTGAGPITRHDGRVSLRHAWPLRRVAELVVDLPVVELRRRFPFRFSLVLAPGVAGAVAPGAGRGDAERAAATAVGVGEVPAEPGRGGA